MNPSTEPRTTYPTDAGRDLDALVAERVMGWKRCVVERHGPDCDYWWENDLIGHNQPAFSGDIADAWRIVERLSFPTDRCYFRLDVDPDGMWVAQFGAGFESPRVKTPALAICLAALAYVRVVGVEPPRPTPGDHQKGCVCNICTDPFN